MCSGLFSPSPVLLSNTTARHTMAAPTPVLDVPSTLMLFHFIRCRVGWRPHSHRSCNFSSSISSPPSSSGRPAGFGGCSTSSPAAPISLVGLTRPSAAGQNPAPAEGFPHPLSGSFHAGRSYKCLSPDTTSAICAFRWLRLSSQSFGCLSLLLSSKAKRGLHVHQELPDGLCSDTCKPIPTVCAHWPLVQ